MLHAWVQRFDVTGGRGNILGSEQGLIIPALRREIGESLRIAFLFL
jgi:hypothetical protein